MARLQVYCNLRGLDVELIFRGRYAGIASQVAQVCDVVRHIVRGRLREWNVRPDPSPLDPELYKLAVEAM